MRLRVRRKWALAIAVAWLLAGCAAPPAARPSPSLLIVPETPPASAPAHDQLDIRSVTFLPAKSPEFVIFVVTVDYALVSSAAGNVGLALDLEAGGYTLVTEQRVKRGGGALELLAECKRSGRVTQALAVSLSEYPGPMPRKTLASQGRTVVLPVAP